MVVNIYFLSAFITVFLGFCGVVGYLLTKHRESVTNIVREELIPIVTRITVMETKLDVFWKDVSLDMARILHHPEASRAHVDSLLERLQEGTLTDGEAEELRGYLEIIRDWEPGCPAPFAVFQGEQVAAAILLHTMHHTRGSK